MITAVLKIVIVTMMKNHQDLCIEWDNKNIDDESDYDSGFEQHRASIRNGAIPPIIECLGEAEFINIMNQESAKIFKKEESDRYDGGNKEDEDVPKLVENWSRPLMWIRGLSC